MSQLKIGDRVKVSKNHIYASDWRETYFVTAIKAKVGSGELDYAIGDNWPPRHLGDFTDGWKDSDLLPAPPEPEKVDWRRYER